MTKITINRTFDKAAIANTDRAKELSPFIDSQLSVNELVLRSLSNGLSFGDNIACLEKLVELKHGVPQTISVGKPVKGVLVQRTFGRMSEPIYWEYNNQNELQITAQFFGSPTVAVKVNVVLLFE